MEPTGSLQRGFFYSAKGADDDDRLYAVAATDDGGYVIAGEADVGDAAGSAAYLAKTGADGKLVWERRYDSAGLDRFVAVQQTSDGGYLATLAQDYAQDYLGASQVVAVKTNAGGVEQWRLNAAAGAQAAKAIQTADGNYVIAWWQGQTGPGTQEWTGAIHVRKFSPSRATLWEATAAGDAGGTVADLVETPDGGFALAGVASFMDPDSHIHVVRVGPSGDVQWARTYGEDGRDSGHAIANAPDGGFIVAGESHPDGEPAHAALLKVAPDGAEEWFGTYGADDADSALSVLALPNGGYVFAGWSESYNDEDEPEHRDALAARVGPNGETLLRLRTD